MQGQGQFTLADLQSFGLSTRNQSPDQAQKKTAEFAQSLTGISQQGSIVNSPETVRQFIANYRQGGGVDAAQALSMVPQVDEAIAQLKAKLGLAPDQPLTGEYQAHLLAKFGRAGNAEGIDAVVQAEMNRIDLAFPSAKGKPLTSQQGSQYVTVGFNLPQSQLPLETAESKTNPKPVARPNSALNSGSQLGNTPVKSLEDRGYNDIQQSPLYSERELQSEFKGDTKKYAQYLARAHYLVEDVLRIPIQDFDGKPSPGDKPGAVAAEGELKNNIKGYLFSRGYDEQSLVAEIGYIQSVRNHFGASAQASGVGGTNPALKSFNAEDYVESGGRVYQYDVPAEIKRPSGPGAMPEVIPASVGRGLIEGASAHETGVLHRAERSQFLQNQMNAHQGLVNLMRDAEKTEANAGEDGEVDMSKADEMKQKVDVRNRFDLMENFMETQAGNKKYIDQDGKAVMAFDAKGQPIMDKTGQHMSLLAFDALKKYGSPETVKLSLQNPNSPDVQAALKGGMKLNAEAISSEAKAKDPNIPDVNYAATKSSELDVNTQETHAETIQKDVDANQRKIEELNENLKTFTAHFDNVGKAFADVFNQETESVSRLFQLMNS